MPRFLSHDLELTNVQIPAEVFPTKYRCTLYGIAAASGKLGSVLVQIILLSVPSILSPNSTTIRWLLLSFAICMAVGGIIAWYTIPHVQYRSLQPPHNRKNISLEKLAAGRKAFGIRRVSGVELSSIDPSSNVRQRRDSAAPLQNHAAI